MLIKSLPVTLFQQNARLLIDSNSKKAVLVDPGGDAEIILQLIANSGVEITDIFLTHSHLDHVGAVADCLQKLTDKQSVAPLLVGSIIEKDFRSRIVEQAARFGIEGADFKNCPEPDRYIEEGDILKVGDIEMKLIFTPGHSPGHYVAFTESRDVILQWYLDGETTKPQHTYNATAPLLIAGDTLFAGSIGRTDLPGGDHATLIASILEKLMVLPDETIVFPGHGQETTIGNEKTSNMFLV